MFTKSLLLLPASLASLALAKTDLSGCTSTDVSSPAGASIAWLVPGTGEICAPLDCGGGRAPPKSSVPGCPAYTGTASYSPSFYPGYAVATPTPAATTSATAAAASSIVSADTAVTSWDLYTTAATPSASSAWITSSAWSTVADGSSWLASTAVWSNSTTAVDASTPSAPSNGTLGTTSIATYSTTGTASRPPATSGLSSQSGSGAMETARAWVGGAGLLGLGAVIAAL